MRYCVILLCLILAGCGKKHDEPGLTSPEGAWTYTTPDKKIAVTFNLSKSSSGALAIQSQSFVLNGTSYNSAAQITGVKLPSIHEIRVNANDVNAVYPYDIEFDSCVVSTDFTTMHVIGATYTWPWGTTLDLSNITISRP
jgi:hypothetical protein